jgi:hypothetical protein
VYDDVLEIVMQNGETMYFMADAKDEGSSMTEWYSALNKRHAWSKTQPAPVRSGGGGASSSGSTKSAGGGGDGGGNSATSGPNDGNIENEKRIHISGYLQKKSHNKYQGYQVR